MTKQRLDPEGSRKDRKLEFLRVVMIQEIVLFFQHIAKARRVSELLGTSLIFQNIMTRFRKYVVQLLETSFILVFFNVQLT